MKLFIDATDNLKTIIRLDDFEFIQKNDQPQDQDVLSAIKKAFNQKKITFSDLSEIEVNPGPGSFTGSRVGVTIANALAFALNLKVNGQKPPISPVYSEPPHITKSKKQNG